QVDWLKRLRDTLANPNGTNPGPQTPKENESPGVDPEPRMREIKFELTKILKTQGEATVPLSVLKAAWAKERGPFFLLRPKLEALANELQCNYELEQETGNTTFFRGKPDSHKG